ncbi:hypothetical protein C8R43DRAFT_1133913 [Mycena crocata]|nr:hypothetical protein C8R43DRAFT_1133913 [Mycena crocata]
MSTSRRSTTAPATNRPPTRMSTRTTPSTTPITVAARLPANTPASRANSELPGDSLETPLFVDTPSPSPAPTSAPVDLGRPRAIQRGEVREIQRAAATSASTRTRNDVPPDVTTQDPIPESPIEGPITPIDLGGGRLPSNWLNRMADNPHIGNRPTDEMPPPALPRSTSLPPVLLTTSTASSDPARVEAQLPLDAAAVALPPQSPSPPPETSHSAGAEDLPPATQIREETVDDADETAARRAAKGKDRAGIARAQRPSSHPLPSTIRLSREKSSKSTTPPPPPPPQTLTPLTIDGNTMLLDGELGGFLTARQCSERYFDFEFEQARLASLRDMEVDSTEVEPPAARRPAATGASPPKRPRIEVDPDTATPPTRSEPRTTRSQTAASRAGSSSQVDTHPTTYASVVSNPTNTSAPLAVTNLVPSASTTSANPPRQTGTLAANTATHSTTNTAQPTSAAAPHGMPPAAPTAASQSTAAAAVQPAAAAAAAVAAAQPVLIAAQPAANPAQAPAIFRTADGLESRLLHTAAPPEGWDSRVGVTRFRLTDPVHPTHIQMWKDTEEEDGPGLFAQRAGGSTNPMTEGPLLGTTVEGFLNLPPGSVKVGVGAAKNPAKGNPNLFFINGLAQDLMDAVEDARVISTLPITILIHNTYPDISGYLGIVEGLMYDEDDNASALTNIRTGMRANIPFTHAVMTHHDAPEVALLSAQQVLETTLASTRVSPILLLDGPDMRIFSKKIRVAFQPSEFFTFGSRGTVRKGEIVCTNCNNLGHTFAHCSLPKAPGYLGESLEDVNTRLSASRGRGRGRGGRGNNGGPRGGRSRGRPRGN